MDQRTEDWDQKEPKQRNLIGKCHSVGNSALSPELLRLNTPYNTTFWGIASTATVDTAAATFLQRRTPPATYFNAPSSK